MEVVYKGEKPVSNLTLSFEVGGGIVKELVKVRAHP